MLKDTLKAGDYFIGCDKMQESSNTYYISSKNFGYGSISWREYFVTVQNNIIVLHYPIWETELNQKRIFSWVLYWLIKSGEDKNYKIDVNNCIVPTEDEIKISHQIFNLLSTDEFSDYTYVNIEDFYNDQDKFPENMYYLEDYLFDN